MIKHPLTNWLVFSNSKLAYRHSITDVLQRNESLEVFIKENIRSIEEINWQQIEDSIQWAEHPNQSIITFQDPTYPSLLKEITHPPPILYIRGNPSILSSPQIAIVGSRYPSHSGITITKTITSDLVSNGLTITSGLALGIDAASHQAAINKKGKTIAVLGNGLNDIYPKQHHLLAEQITEQGCVISEFALNTQPNKKNFPRRNRIISGLSFGTLVVEAKMRSGSLITARCAAEQGREVFAIPGSIRHSLSQGCHQLIRDGATLTESAKDIMDVLNISPICYSSDTYVSKCNRPETGLDSKQQQLLACVDYEPTSIDEVIERSGFSASLSASLLLNLELHGYISSAPRGFVRVK